MSLEGGVSRWSPCSDLRRGIRGAGIRAVVRKDLYRLMQFGLTSADIARGTIDRFRVSMHKYRL